MEDGIQCCDDKLHEDEDGMKKESIRSHIEDLHSEVRSKITESYHGAQK